MVHIPVLRGRSAAQHAIAALLDGGGGLLVLDGEAGSGRSVLLAHARLAAAGRTCLVTAGAAEESDRPYGALRQLLDPLRDGIRRLPRAHRPVLGRALAGGAVDPAEVGAATLALVSRAARTRPVLCTVDDHEWLDAPSAAVVAHIARRVGGLRVGLLLAGGPPFAPAVRLAPLGPDESAALVRDHTGCDLAPGVGARLHELARGNPAALVDLATALTADQCQGLAPLPATVGTDGQLGRGYRVRLRRLPAATRALVLAAALEPALDGRGLARLAQTAADDPQPSDRPPPSHVPAPDPQPDDRPPPAAAPGPDPAATPPPAGRRPPSDLLAPAEVAGLVRAGPEAVRLAHPVLREVAVRHATLAERAAAHRMLARTLTGDRHRLRRAVHRAAALDDPEPDAALADELAAAAAGGDDCALGSVALERAAALTADARQAAARLTAAARLAWLSGDPARARRLLGRTSGDGGLLQGELTLHSGSTREAFDLLVTAADRLPPDLAWHALARAAEAIWLDGDHRRYVDVARRTARLTRPPRRDTRFVLSPSLAARYLAGVSALVRGDHDQAVGHLRDLGDHGDDPVVLVFDAAAALLVGDDDRARRTARHAVDAAREVGATAVVPRALEVRAFAEYWLGAHDAAARAAREGLRVARATGQTGIADNHLGLLAVLAALHGDRDGCLRAVRGIDPAPVGASRSRALAAWALAVLDLAAGRYPEALHRLTGLADVGTGGGNVLIQATATPYLVEAATGAGAPDAAAVAALAAFERWADATGEPVRRAVAARCRGLTAPRGSDTARSAFRTALRLHPPGFERARTDLLFGRELRRSRQPRQAREHLRRAVEDFTAAGAPIWADQAAAELRAAGAAVDPPPAVVALTTQQQRVARLVADGATNREVAASLYLSTRTVDHHLRNIFNRLGVRSRTELARAIRN